MAVFKRENLLEELHGVGIDGEGGSVDLRLLRDEVHASLALSLLKLEGDTADGTLLNTLHQVSDVTSDLVTKTLGGDDGNLLGDLLVELEVHGQLLVVSLDDLTSGSLDGLSSDAAHEE